MKNNNEIDIVLDKIKHSHDNNNIKEILMNNHNIKAI